jgi:CRISPR-associated endonuclease/helicase Cas3
MMSDANRFFMAHYRQSDATAQSVREHLEETSTFASTFAGKIGLSSFGELAGLLHDVGKYSTAFQEYLESAIGQSDLSSDDDNYIDAKKMKGKIDHSSAGAQLYWHSAITDKSPVNSIARQMIALCVASHHSGLIDCVSPLGQDKFNERMMKITEPACLEEERYIRERITSLLASHKVEDELNRQMNVLRDICQPEMSSMILGLMTRFLFSSLIDADRLSTADFENQHMALERYHGKYPEWDLLIGLLENHLAGFTTRNRVDEIRNKISATCLSFAEREKGLYQLSVPTGGGKTLASLRFALSHAKKHRMDRIIYVAPYTSIIDQNARVARSIFENNKNTGKQIVLEHHSNLTPEQDTWSSKILSENWDAPIVFTTAVQLLETLFGAGTRGVRRMHQLANAVIVFDEVQTLPINTIHLFNNAINFMVGHCGSTVLFCTATQPLLDQVDVKKGAARLSDNPEMIPDIQSLFRDLRRVDVIDKRKTGGWTVDEVADVALQEMANTGSVLVVVNMKSQAREVYLRCREKSERVFHLSTSMCPAHRMDILNKIRVCLDPADPKPIVCISTQLIEAGVDVDFGMVIRYLAGLDSIAQAAGRCNRNGLRETSRVFIVNPSKENLDNLPDIHKAKEVTERVLHEYQDDPAAFDNDLQSPKIMARYYYYYFFERAHEMAYSVSAKDIGRDDTLLSLLSTNERSIAAYKRVNKAVPEYFLRQSFKSAADAFRVIDSPTEGVIVPYGEDDHLIAKMLASVQIGDKVSLLKRAQRYSVNIFPHQMKLLKDNCCLHEVWECSKIYWLDSRYYSEEFGVSIEQIELK